ncbi:MAG: hypothetical protein Q4C50_12245 [Eubacteriales bacterium]|nr:hypothetical protein [Eubacteriales bacterium]
MKQPDSLDVGTQMDVARHRLRIAKEDLETANLTFEAVSFIKDKDASASTHTDE